jgi:hypothetical protein
MTRACSVGWPQALLTSLDPVTAPLTHSQYQRCLDYRQLASKHSLYSSRFSSFIVRVIIRPP